MKTKKQILIAFSTTCLSVVSISAIINNRNNKLIRAKAETQTITLNSSTSTGLTSSPGDSTFSTAFGNNGNSVSWKCHNAKSSSGNLMILGKTEFGNVDSADNYLGNTTAITTISEITVNFGTNNESDYVRIFGGLDPNDDSSFYYMDLLTPEHNSTTNVNNYYYFRIVNNDHLNDECIISSVVVNFDCESVDISNDISAQSEKSEMLNNIYTGSALPSSTNQDELYSEDYSSKSAVINDNSYYYLNLPSTIVAGQLSRWVLEYYFMVPAGYTASGGAKTANYLELRSFNNTTKVSDASAITNKSTSAGKGWTKYYGNLADIFASDDGSKNINNIRIKTHYVSDSDKYVLIDGMRIYLDDNYPAVATDVNDLAVASNVAFPSDKNPRAYVAMDYLGRMYNDGLLEQSTSSLKFYANSAVSWSSSSIYLSNGGVTSFDVSTDSARTIEFYLNLSNAVIKNGSTMDADAAALKVALGTLSSGYGKLSSTINCSSITNLGDGWYKYSFLVSEFGSMATGTTFTFIYLQLNESKVTQTNIDDKKFFVVDRLSISDLPPAP